MSLLLFSLLNVIIAAVVYIWFIILEKHGS